MFLPRVEKKCRFPLNYLKISKESCQLEWKKGKMSMIAVKIFIKGDGE